MSLPDQAVNWRNPAIALKTPGAAGS